MSETDLHPYTEEQVIKLTQFDRCNQVIQFLRSKEDLLIRGAKYWIGQPPYPAVLFDETLYRAVQGGTNKLINQLLDLGLPTEIKDITRRPLKEYPMYDPNEEM